MDAGEGTLHWHAEPSFERVCGFERQSFSIDRESFSRESFEREREMKKELRVT